jgi:D-glycero-D-manno-heptose 1,7-bisphosphate phosphatase
MTRPTQAVILPGAGAERPDGGTIPEAAVRIRDRLFIEYQLEQLRQEGFTDVVLLPAWGPDAVRERVGDGRQFGLNVEYVPGEGGASLLQRMRAARRLLGTRVLLMHAGSYCPLDFARLWQHYRDAGAPAMLTVYRNAEAYAADTVSVDSRGLIEEYDANGRRPGLAGTAVGYAVLHRDLLELPHEGSGGFESELYRTLIARQQLAAYVTDHRWYSVATLDAQRLATTFFARRPTVILDRDGVLNRRPTAGSHVRSAADFQWLPGALDALRAFREADYTVIVASNHLDASEGPLPVGALEEIHAMMRMQAHAAGGAIDAIYHCPHDWYVGCDCRSPRPGLLLQAQRDFSLDLTRTYVIVSDERDLRAAAACGAMGRLVTPDEPLLVHAQQLLAVSAAVRR